MSSNVLNIKDLDELNEKLDDAGKRLVIINFFATWCLSSTNMAPRINRMSEDLKDTVVFLKVDVDKCEEIARKYSINLMPTFVFIKVCKKVDLVSGENEEKLNELIEKYK